MDGQTQSICHSNRKAGVTIISGPMRFLVVSLPLDPRSGSVATEESLPALVIDEDEKGEGEGGKPPVDVQRVHPKTLVHARGVGQESGQNGLEYEAKVHEVVLHPLLEHGVLPGLTDDEIGPLHDHDRDEEGGVASVLEDLPVGIGPLLTIGVLQIVDSSRVP